MSFGPDLRHQHPQRGSSWKLMKCLQGCHLLEVPSSSYPLTFWAGGLQDHGQQQSSMEGYQRAMSQFTVSMFADGE
jgi:hypothetical protein